MKLDYLVFWSERAEAKLLDKADYIYNDSQNDSIANDFLEIMRSTAEKLSFVASAYADGKFHIYPLKYGHAVKFIVVGDVVIIADFHPKGSNLH
ncbi:type II toxin-antitoxin system RelE/ParE family toxin [Testudinibacter sp. P80/BLE/0925]|uniref:type II toxin-antitoxin system RelE/ParE family toxin n=1 Tax=Testudinibacter sp. TW-1 TaxID=3417757 RepID=UPI003D36786B